jgi:uncharacterized protein YfeS
VVYLLRQTLLKVAAVIAGLVLFVVVGLVGLIWFVMSNARPISPEESAQMVAQAQNAPTDETYTVDRKHASATALKLMKPDWFWDITDDNSPFGNDDGADGLAFYRKWRKTSPNANPIIGVATVCDRLESPFFHWKATTRQQIDSDIGARNFLFTSPGDQIVIAIAFGQLVDEGHVDRQLREIALQAIHNEKMPKISNLWVDSKQRTARLTAMESVLSESVSVNP